MLRHTYLFRVRSRTRLRSVAEAGWHSGVRTALGGKPDPVAHDRLRIAPAIGLPAADGVDTETHQARAHSARALKASAEREAHNPSHWVQAPRRQWNRARLVQVSDREAPVQQVLDSYLRPHLSGRMVRIAPAPIGICARVEPQER